jgi:hypothetical protein
VNYDYMKRHVRVYHSAELNKTVAIKRENVSTFKLRLFSILHLVHRNL